MITQNQLNDPFFIPSKKLRLLNIFWLGFIIDTVSLELYSTGFANFAVCQAFQLLGLVILLVASASLISFKIENNYLRTPYFLYCFWALLIILRFGSLNYTSAKSMLFRDSGIFLYFVPLILLFPKKIFFYKKLFEVIIILAVFYVIFNIVFFKYLFNRSSDSGVSIENLSDLSLPCGFILLTYTYHSNKKILFAAGVMILTLICSIYNARRGLSFIFLSTLLSSYFLYLIKTKRKVLTIYLSLVTIIISAFYVDGMYQTNKNGLFSFIIERGDEDTRTGVEIYLYQDLKMTDWIVGRGINGEYYCPDIEKNQLTDYRDYIETGYLQIILKGGIIRLALYLLIAIPAIILGFFYSKNLLSKASAIWIFIAIISLYPASVEKFYLQYLLVWISIGICYSKKLRYLPDNTLSEFFKRPSTFMLK